MLSAEPQACPDASKLGMQHGLLQSENGCLKLGRGRYAFGEAGMDEVEDWKTCLRLRRRHATLS